MSAHVNRAMLTQVQQDEADAEWLAAQLQWKYGYAPGHKEHAKNLMRLIKERFGLDIIPSDDPSRLEALQFYCNECGDFTAWTLRDGELCCATHLTGLVVNYRRLPTTFLRKRGGRQDGAE